MINLDIDEKIFSIFDIKEKEIIEKYINNIIKLIIKEENLTKKNIYLTIQMVNEEEIRKINNEYRNIDKKTDVLSFPVFEKYELDQIREGNIKINEIELGDIFICMEVIKSQAIEYETGLKRELAYMITHGTLHLLGYDHIDLEDKKIMREKEERILKNGEI